MIGYIIETQAQIAHVSFHRQGRDKLNSLPICTHMVRPWQLAKLGDGISSFTVYFHKHYSFYGMNSAVMSILTGGSYYTDNSDYSYSQKKETRF